MERGLFVKLLVTGTAMSSRRDNEMQAKPTTTKRLAVEAYYRTSWAKGAPVPDVQPFMNPALQLMNKNSFCQH